MKVIKTLCNHHPPPPLTDGPDKKMRIMLSMEDAGFSLLVVVLVRKEDTKHLLGINARETTLPPKTTTATVIHAA